MAGLKNTRVSDCQLSNNTTRWTDIPRSWLWMNGLGLVWKPRKLVHGSIQIKSAEDRALLKCSCFIFGKIWSFSSYKGKFWRTDHGDNPIVELTYFPPLPATIDLPNYLVLKYILSTQYYFTKCFVRNFCFGVFELLATWRMKESMRQFVILIDYSDIFEGWANSTSISHSSHPQHNMPITPIISESNESIPTTHVHCLNRSYGILEGMSATIALQPIQVNTP